MVTRIAAIGDFHAAPGPRNADRFTALDQVIAHVLGLPSLGACAWPGDLYDSVSTVEDRNAIYERATRIATACPLLIARGNHDKKGELLALARLRTSHPIYVFEEPGCFRFKLATNEWATVFVLPYPEKGGLVGAGIAPGDVVGTAADILEPIFMVAADELQRAAAAGDLTFMIGHINVAGSMASTGQPQIGHEIELSPRHLERLGNIPKILNHIHKPQTIAGAHYVGSVARQDYGEIEEKRFLVVECEREGDEGGHDRDRSQPFGAWRHQFVSVPIAVAPMFHIEGELTGIGFLPDSTEVLCSACAGTGDGERDPVEGTLSCAACHGSGRREDWSGTDVRLRIRYLASQRAALDFESVKTVFAGAIRLKVETVAIIDRDVRAPEVAAAKTLSAKLAAFRKEAALPPSLEAKLALLQQPDPIAAVEAARLRLAAIAETQRETVAA